LAYRLALAWGVPDPDQLLAGMTSAQLAGWMAFAELEPFGPLREDERAAVVACAVANSIPFRGRGAQSLKPSDLFRSLCKPFEPMSAEQMAERAKARTIAAGGEVRSMPKPTPAELAKLRKRKKGRKR
jgi:hypothetical protein